MSCASSIRIRLTDQHARMSGGKLARPDQRLHRRRQFQQPHRVRDMAAALADDARNIFLRIIELISERLVAGRFFHRIEIGALDVFDDRHLQRFAVVRFDDDNRHVVQRGALRSTPSPFAGDDFEMSRCRGSAAR